MGANERNWGVSRNQPASVTSNQPAVPAEVPLAAGTTRAAQTRDSARNSIADAVSRGVMSQLLSQDFLAPIEQLVREVVTEMTETLPKLTEEQAKRLADEIACGRIDEALSQLPKLTSGDVRSAVGEAIDGYHLSPRLTSKIESASREMAEKIVAAHPQLTMREVEVRIRELSGEIASAVVSGAVASLPKVTREEVRASAAEAVDAYHESSRLVEIIDRLANQIAATKVDEAVSGLPKLTPEEVRGLVENGVRSYHASLELDRKIEEIAGGVAARLVEPLPKVTREEIASAIRGAILTYHDSGTLNERISTLAQEVAARLVESLPKVTPEEVRGTAAEEIETYHHSLRMREGMENTARGIVAEALASLPDFRGLLQQGFEEYHTSPELSEKIEKLSSRIAREIVAAEPRLTMDEVEAGARRLAEEIASVKVREAAGPLWKANEETLQKCLQALEDYQQSVELEGRIRKLAEEIAVKKVGDASVQLLQLMEENLQTETHEALETYHTSKRLDEKIDAAARRLAEEVSGGIVSESEARQQEQWKEDARAMSEMAVDSYHSSALLEEKIESAARKLAEEVAERRILETIEALPKLTPADVEKAIGTYHDSETLRERISSLAREMADRALDQRPVPLSESQVQDLARRQAEEVVASLPKTTTEDVITAVRGAIEDYHGSPRMEERVRALAEQLDQLRPNWSADIEQKVRGLAEEISDRKVAEAKLQFPTVSGDVDPSAIRREIESSVRSLVEEAVARKGDAVAAMLPGLVKTAIQEALSARGTEVASPLAHLGRPESEAKPAPGVSRMEKPYATRSELSEVFVALQESLRDMQRNLVSRSPGDMGMLELQRRLTQLEDRLSGGDEEGSFSHHHSSRKRVRRF